MARIKNTITALSILIWLLTVPLNANELSQTLTNDLLLLESKARSYDYHEIQQARQLAEKLNNIAKQSSEALSVIVSALKNSPENIRLAKYLLPDLATNPNQRVTQLAFDLLQSKITSDQLIATELLSSRSKLTPLEKEQLLTIVITQLADVEDTQIVDSLLVLLQTTKFSQSSTSNIVDAIQPLCSSKTESVRSNSYFAIAKYAQTSKQLTCIISALNHHNQSDKNSAIMALSQISIKDDLIEKALKQFADNPKTTDENRYIAKQLLKAY